MSDEINVLENIDFVKSLNIPIGTIKEWKDGLYQKVDEGKWVKWKPNYPRGYNPFKGTQIFSRSKKLTDEDIANLNESEDYLIRREEGIDEFVRVKYAGTHKNNHFFIDTFNFLHILSQLDLETDAIRKLSEADKVIVPPDPKIKPLNEEEKNILNQIERGSIIIVNRGSYNAKAIYIDQTKNFEFKPITGKHYNENDVEVRLGGSKKNTTIKVLDIISVETKNPDKLYRIFSPGYEFQMNFVLGKEKNKEIHEKFEIGQFINSGLKGFSPDHKVKFTGYFPHLFVVQSIDSEGRKFYNLTRDVNLYTTEEILNLNQLRNKELNIFGEEQLQDKILKPLVNYKINQLPIKNKELFLNNFRFYKNELKFDVSNPFEEEKLDEKGKPIKQDRVNEVKIQDFVMEMEDAGFPFKGRYNTKDGRAKITFDIDIR